MASQAGFFQRHQNIVTYVPNLIGYVRILLALYAFAVAFTSPVQTVLAYFFSFVCDELDGRFARMLNQTSTLGAVLDMVTDRLATTGLLVIVALTYPSLHVLVILLFMLDIFSHWFQMYSTLLSGAASHKDVRSRSLLVRFYYSNRMFMGFCCICCEVLYLMIYMGSWPRFMDYRIPRLDLQLPVQVAKLAPGLQPFFSPGGLPVVTLMALATLPGFMVKQVCNWVQLKNAADSLIEYDQRKDAQKEDKFQ